MLMTCGNYFISGISTTALWKSFRKMVRRKRFGTTSQDGAIRMLKLLIKFISVLVNYSRRLRRNEILHIVVLALDSFTFPVLKLKPLKPLKQLKKTLKQTLKLKALHRGALKPLKQLTIPGLRF